jgi:hypothetical protein
MGCRMGSNDVVLRTSSGGVDTTCPPLLEYVLEALAKVAMLVVTFWRFVWNAVWWFIGLVIVLAIIKGAFIVVSRL